MTDEHPNMDDENLLEVDGLRQYFPIRRGLFNRVAAHVKAVDDVSFHLRQGETLGLVGESGSGKTTVGRCIVRLYTPHAGRIWFRADTGPVEVSGLSKAQLRPIRRQIQMLFQDPNSSLDARMRVGDIIAEPLEIHGIGNRRSRQERVELLLQQVGLSVETINRYPHQLSGGQRQRIGVARALSIAPRLIICDEPVSALDVSVQAQVLNLLADLQKELGLTYIFIAHDLSVVEYISSRVLVLYLGRIVESAPTSKIFTRPTHPYTEALLNAIPKRSVGGYRRRIVLTGDLPSPVNPPSGCVFHTRCKYAQDRCRSEIPTLRPFQDDLQTLSACHFAGQLELQPFFSEPLPIQSASFYDPSHH
jgi:oligopeptide/dipeptide ABC transporter ATP-binding protein